MQTGFSEDDPENLTVACTVYVHQYNRLDAATILRFYSRGCHVESQVSLSPGMTVSLSLHVSGSARVTLGPCLVTWARKPECGLQFPQGPSTHTHGRNLR
jgi:hypothetical protein